MDIKPLQNEFYNCIFYVPEKTKSLHDFYRKRTAKGGKTTGYHHVAT